MPQTVWSPKRERQYEHIKESQEDRGVPVQTAKEIAARTVNKERARAGESRQASRTSTNDISSGRRGGLRSHRGAGGRTRDQLYRKPSGGVSGDARRCRRASSRTPSAGSAYGELDGRAWSVPSPIGRERETERR